MKPLTSLTLRVTKPLRISEAPYLVRVLENGLWKHNLVPQSSDFPAVMVRDVNIGKSRLRVELKVTVRDE